MTDGLDYIDYVTSGRDHGEYSFEEATSLENLPQPILRAAVVAEVLYDPGVISEDKLEQLEDGDPETGIPRCINKVHLQTAPRNSILARDITDASDRQQRASILAYPLFPPSLCLPVKPGETVWLIDASPQEGSRLTYWVCRISAPDNVDDLNFTHYDRISLERAKQTKAKTKPTQPEFFNGAGQTENYTLQKPDDYELIFTQAIPNVNHTITNEAVPRFKKRPGDLALQGSNNTLICLGEDRGWTAAPPPIGTGRPSDATTDHGGPNPNISNATWRAGPTVGAQAPSVLLKGTIDIVAGRGVKGTKTAPLVIENSRNFEETNKNPVLFPPNVENNYYTNPCEGDPDFVEDLSRIYVSMKTSGDTNFGLVYPPIVGADLALPIDDAPYVIVKSTHVRVVARDSVRLVAGPASNCVASFLADGTMALAGTKIVTSGPVELGDGLIPPTEPLVLGNQLVIQLNAIISAVNAGFLIADSNITEVATETGFAGPLQPQQPLPALDPKNILSTLVRCK